MKTVALVLGTITLAVVLIVAGAWLGILFAQDRGGYDMMGFGTRIGPGTMMGPGGALGCDAIGSGRSDVQCDVGQQGYGMMGGNWDAIPCSQGYSAPDSESALSLEDAQAAVERYVAYLGYDGLHVTEVMEFERNFYAIVAEEDTGIGAMELLIDKSSGAVGPEPGPNMMWNAKYGMHGRGRMGMMGNSASGEMTLSPQEAEKATQRWLDANLPGRTTGEADAFSGYYTLHFLKDGQIDGMLSVHGGNGEVWYHSWHGGFVAMTGEHE